MTFKEKVSSLSGKRVYVYTSGQYPLSGILSEVTNAFMVLDKPPHCASKNSMIVNLSSVIAVEEVID